MPRTFRCELPVAVAGQQEAHGQTANSPGEGGVLDGMANQLRRRRVDRGVIGCLVVPAFLEKVPWNT